MDIAWQQKLQELEIQFLRHEQERLQDDILRGIDNPIREIINLRRWQVEIETVRQTVNMVMKIVEAYSEELVLEKIKTLFTELQQHKLMAPEIPEKKEFSADEEEKSDGLT